MKVAIVLNTSWNIYNFRMGLVKSLQENGHEVVAIAPHDRFSHLLEEAGCQYIPLKMDSRGANPIKDSLLILELYKIYKKVNPDLVLHFTIKPNVYGTIAATLLKIPVVNNVCGLGTVFLKKNMVSYIAEFLYKVSFRFPKKIFFQNQYDKDLFLQKNLINGENAEVIPGSGIDLQKFQPTEYKKDSKFTFLLISRLITDKGVLEFIEAVKQLKSEGINANFQILGPKDPLHKRGIALEVIDSWIADDLIEYLGSTEDVRPFISESHCVVLPSYREGTPRTLLEGASLAKPLLATNVPGCINVVEDQVNGLLCEPRNAQDLAAKMRQIYHLPKESLIQMGLNSRKKVENEFQENFVVERYLNTVNSFQKGYPISA
jgi:glycosyltransferase involved in cell wall biosynthesis